MVCIHIVYTNTIVGMSLRPDCCRPSKWKNDCSYPVSTDGTRICLTITLQCWSRYFAVWILSMTLWQASLESGNYSKQMVCQTDKIQHKTVIKMVDIVHLCYSYWRVASYFRYSTCCFSRSSDFSFP